MSKSESFGVERLGPNLENVWFDHAGWCSLALGSVTAGRVGAKDPLPALELFSDVAQRLTSSVFLLAPKMVG